MPGDGAGRGGPRPGEPPPSSVTAGGPRPVPPPPPRPPPGRPRPRPPPPWARGRGLRGVEERGRAGARDGDRVRLAHVLDRELRALDGPGRRGGRHEGGVSDRRAGA